PSKGAAGAACFPEGAVVICCCGKTGGGGAAAADGICGSTGTVKVAVHSGHFIIWPAYCSGTWSCFWQVGHRRFMRTDPVEARLVSKCRRGITLCQQLKPSERRHQAGNGQSHAIAGPAFDL